MHRKRVARQQEELELDLEEVWGGRGRLKTLSKETTKPGLEVPFE